MPSPKEKLHAAEFAKRLGKADGIPMGKIFALAKEFTGMPPAEIEKLLENKRHEMRVGAVSIMDRKARAKFSTSWPAPTSLANAALPSSALIFS